jgi:dethiobiotin synthetase
VNFLITGTDTGVGKTYVTCGLIRALRKSGHAAAGLKPFCSGGWEDVEAIMAANEQAVPLHGVNSVSFQTPLAPYAAALVENRTFDLVAVKASFAAVQSRFSPILVEGAGGLLVPILRDYDFGDLARDWGLSLIVVAANRLGVLNHCRLTVEAAQRRGLPVSAIVLNELDKETDLARQTNPAVLQDVLGTPILHLAYESTDLTLLIAALRPG